MDQEGEHKLRFHARHSNNIHLSEDGFSATRNESYHKAICVTHRPISVSEHVNLSIARVSSAWNGCLRVGFTFHEPSTFTKQDLISLDRPGLTQNDGYWVRGLPEKFCKQESEVYFYHTRDGDLMCGMGAEVIDLFSGIPPNVPLYAVFDVHGSTITIDIIEPGYTTQLQQVGLHVTYDCDSMMICEDTTVAKAVMPCGHIMGEEAMCDYLQSLFPPNTTGDYKIICPLPNCQKEWMYESVSTVAQMSLPLRQQVEENMAMNFIYKTSGNKQCGQCQTICYRENMRTICLRCTYCSKSSGAQYNFCWACGQRWMKSTSSQICGNTGCDGIDPRVHTVQNCGTKTIKIGTTLIPNCPEIRACPKCGILIEHTEACKHMTCRNCRHSFCFSCLKGRKNNRWECGSYNTVCQPAPKQTVNDIVGALSQ